MKKIYDLGECLTSLEIQQMQNIAKKLSKRYTNHSFKLTSQWVLLIYNNCIQLQLIYPHFRHSQVVKNDSILPSIKSIKNLNEIAQDSLQYAQIKKLLKIIGKEYPKSIYIKVIEFIDDFIHKNKYHGQREVILNLGVLGSLKFNKFKADYYNSSNQLKWSIVHYARPSKQKLETVLNYKTHNKSGEKIIRHRSVSGMSRKFSQSSFKQHKIQRTNEHSVSKQKTKQNVSVRERCNSLPSLCPQISKQNHKKILKKMQMIKALTKTQQKANNQDCYLKIDTKQKYKGKRVLTLAVTDQKQEPKQKTQQCSPISKHQNKIIDRQLKHKNSLNLSHSIESNSDWKQEGKATISNISIKGNSTQKILTQCQLINNLVQNLHEEKSNENAKCLTQAVIGSEDINNSSVTLTLSQTARKIRGDSPSVQSKTPTKLTPKIPNSNITPVQMKKHVSIQIKKRKSVMMESNKHYKNPKMKLNIREPNLKPQEYSLLRNEEQEKNNVLWVKTTITKLLSRNQTFSNNKELLEELFQLYQQKQLQKTMEAKMTLGQSMAAVSANKIYLSRKKKYNSLTKQSKSIQKSKIQQIQHIFSQKHQSNKFIEKLIKEITECFNHPSFQQKNLGDASDPNLLNQIHSLHQLFLLHKTQIFTAIEHHIDEIFQRQQHQKYIKLKFDKYKYSNSHKNTNTPQFLSGQQIHKYTKSKQSEAINEFGTKQQKKMKQMIIDYHIERREMLKKYYYENYYMPYFYILSQLLTNLFFNFFAKINSNCELVLIQLTDFASLKNTIITHSNQIEKVYDFFINFFQQIPHKPFKLQPYQLELVRDQINCRKDQIIQYQQQWQTHIINEYSPFEQFLITFQTQQQKIRELYKKNSNNLLFKQRQEEMKKMQNKLQKLMEVKTFIRCKQFVLDTYLAKSNLIRRYEHTIMEVYEKTYETLNQISLAWSQEMARTQRLMAEELAEEENQITVKIKYYAKHYYNLAKFYIFNQKYLFSNQEKAISHIGSQNQMLLKNFTQNKQKTPKLKKQKSRQILLDAPKDLHEQYEKCLNYSYNMHRKNQQKIAQIAFLVEKYKQKVIYASKHLQLKQKQSKAQYQQLSNQLKRIIRDIKCRPDLMNYQSQIRQLQYKYKIYQQNSKKLHEEMIRNCMIVWEDDDFLVTNLNACTRTISFIDSEIYRKINFSPIDAIRFQHFYKYSKNLQKLMKVIQNHKFQQLFKGEYDLSKIQFQFVEMVLYKDYTVTQIQEIFLNQGIDIRPTISNVKIFDLVRMFKNRPAMYKGISKVYYKRKQEKYVKAKQKPIKIDMQISEQKVQSLMKINNYEEIKCLLEQEIQSSTLPEKQKQMRIQQIKVMNKLMAIYEIFEQHQIMIKEIDTDIKEQDHVNILLHMQKLKLYYHNALKCFKNQRNFNISKDRDIANQNFKEKDWEKLLALTEEISGFKLRTKFYNYLSQMSARLIMLPSRLLICLMDWNTQVSVLRNLKILFPEVIDVQFGQRNSIAAISVSRGKQTDRICMSSGPIHIEKQQKKGKLIRAIQKQVHKSLLQMIRNSNGRTGQIKILHWLLYFTEQVQQSIITNSSLKILQSSIHDTISSIKLDLRYDILNHKQAQIGQLNTFIHYIRDFLGEFPQINSFQWQSTIRAYEKNNCVMIQQNNLQFYYGFEPKSAKILHEMNWNLGLNVTYGDIYMRDLYKYKSYILGVPYFQLTQYKDSYFSEQKNVTKLLLTLQSNSYICSIFEPQQQQSYIRSIFNQIHKQIMNYYLNKSKNIKIQENTYQQEGQDDLNINMKGKFSILFIYKEYERIPPCFLTLYKCKNRKKFDQHFLNLHINILVQCSSIANHIKCRLIWKIIKLIKALNYIKSSTSDQLINIVKNILNIIEKEGNITKEIKNQIYCYLVDNFQSDYTVVSNLINEIITAEDIVCTNNTNNNPQNCNKTVQLISRGKLLNRTQEIYNEMINSNSIQRKPIVIYGQQPSCKTSFITKNIGLELAEVDGYIEGSEVKYIKDKVSSNSLQAILPLNIGHQQKKFPYTCIETGTLFEISPNILSMCHLLYIPALIVQNNQAYQDELRLYFESYLLNTDAQISKSYLQKMWEAVSITYKVYCQFKKPQYKVNIQLNYLIDQICRLFDYFATVKNTEMHKNIKQTDENSEYQSILKQKLYLCFISCYELLIYSLPERNIKKSFIQSLKKQLSGSKDLKGQFKMEQLDSLTYTTQKNIIKFDTSPNNKAFTSFVKNQTNFLLPIINKQVYMALRYMEMGQNVCINGNNLHLFNMLTLHIDLVTSNAANTKKAKFQYKQESNKVFKVKTNMNKFHSVYEAIEKIYSKKKSRVNLSKGMVSGKIMQLATSRALIYNESEKVQITQKKTIIFIDDLHMGTTQTYSQLSTMLNRNTNHNFTWENRDKQVFILFNNRTYSKDKPISNRLLRHTIQITLPDLQLPTIFKLRTQLMISQDQSNLPIELYKTGIFGRIQEKQSNSSLKSIVEKKQISQNYIDFAIQTSLKLPSQFYSKYLLNKLFHLALNPSSGMTQLNLCQYRPKETINNLIQHLKKVQTTNRLVQKYLIHGCSTFYIRERGQNWLQMELKTIEYEVNKYMTGIPYPKKLIAEILSHYLSLIISNKIYIVKSDLYGILNEMSASVTNKRQKFLTHNFFKQITEELTFLTKNKQAYIIINIPQYLLHCKQFIQFFQSILCNKQVLIENKDLLNYWWECVSEQEFIENRYDQYQAIKGEISDALLNRITFIVEIYDIEFEDALQLVSSVQFQNQQRNIQKYKDMAKFINTQQATSSTNMLQLSYENQTILNPSHLTKILQSQKEKKYEKKQHYCGLFKHITLINTQFTKEQQMILVDKLMEYYIENMEPSETSIQYIKIAIKYLKMIIEKINKDQQQHINKKNLVFGEKSNKNSIFYSIYQSLPIIIMSICQTVEQENEEIYTQHTALNVLNNEPQKYTLSDLIQSLQAQISLSKQSKQGCMGKIEIYKKTSQKMSQQLLKFNRFEKENGYKFQYKIDKSGVEDKQDIQQQTDKPKKTKIGRYINEEYTTLKESFIQLNCSCINWTDQIINFENVANLRELIDFCFKSKEEQGLANNKKVQKRLHFNNYLECDVNFVRLCNVDHIFIQFLTQLSQQQYQKSITSLSQCKNFISNYNSLKLCLQYCYKTVKFFNKYSIDNEIIIDNVIIPQSFILDELMFIQYIGLLDTLSICKNMYNDINEKFKNIEKVQNTLENCIKFLMEIGNYEVETQSTAIGKRKKNLDLQIKLKIFSNISDLILSKLKHNAGLHFTIHKQLELQDPKNILVVLQTPKLMYPYKWQQIQNQIFNPCYNPTTYKAQPSMKSTKKFTTNKSNLSKDLKNLNSICSARRKTLQNKRLSIELQGKQFSQHFLKTHSILPSTEMSNENKYIIVYDPYSQLGKFLENGCNNTRHFGRKIIYLHNKKQSSTVSFQQNEKIMKINHVPTYYIYYFKQLINSYHQNLNKLNQILKLMNKKNGKGQGQNDRLIILMKEKYLCEDIKNNANFYIPQTKITSQKSNNNEKLVDQNPQNISVRVVHLELTEMDLIQFLKLEQKPKKRLLQQSEDEDQKQYEYYHQKGCKKLSQCSTICRGQNCSLKDLQTLRSEFNMCKNYLKTYIKSVSDQCSEQSGSSLSYLSLTQVIRCLEQYYQLKNELLAQYNAQRIIDYDYYLNEQNLNALENMHSAILYMTNKSMVPMDFIWKIGNFITIFQFIEKLMSNQEKPKKQKTRKNISKHKFDSCQSLQIKSISTKQEQVIKAFRIITQLFDEYKGILSNKICALQQNLLNSNPQKCISERERVMKIQMNSYHMLILVYDNFQNWIIKGLLEQYDKSNLTIIFDYEPNSFEMYLELITTSIRKEKKIIFLVHQNFISNVKDLIHALKIFWI